MTLGFGVPSEPDLSGLYDRHFTGVPADTPELLDAAHALRYRVYCVVHESADPALQRGERGRDRYGEHAVHSVLIARSSGNVVGCVRLIIPHGDAPSLPLWDLLGSKDRERLDAFGRHRTAEIARYGIAKMYRRREGESLYA